jgi:hypothetical protein
MNMRHFLFIAIAGLSLLPACKKQELRKPADCQQLQSGITTDNKEQVKEVINGHIAGLPSQTYTEQNLNALVNAINGQCGNTATLLCFDCIQTLPSQTEIRIAYTGTAGPVARTIDIIYTSSNRMTFSNMHE